VGGAWIEVADQKAADSNTREGTLASLQLGWVSLCRSEASGTLFWQSKAHVAWLRCSALSRLASHHRRGLRYAHSSVPFGPEGWQASGYVVQAADLRWDCFSCAVRKVLGEEGVRIAEEIQRRRLPVSGVLFARLPGD